MYKKLHKLCVGVGAGAVALGLSAVGARANSVKVDWYSVSPSFGDFNLPPCGTYDCGQVYDNSDPEVGPTLVGNRPVVSTNNPAGSRRGLEQSAQLVDTLPRNYVRGANPCTASDQSGRAFVPEGTGSGDGSLFQTAIFFATLHVGALGGSITFGGDDDMFLALNGKRGRRGRQVHLGWGRPRRLTCRGRHLRNGRLLRGSSRHGRLCKPPVVRRHHDERSRAIDLGDGVGWLRRTRLRFTQTRPKGPACTRDRVEPGTTSNL